jgi:predicted dehydrogenase
MFFGGCKMSDSSLTRRSFIKASTIGAASFAVPIFVPEDCFGANDRIGIGVIGCGGRGQALMMMALKFRQEFNLQIGALCDVWKLNIENSVAGLVSAECIEPKTFSRHAELLALEDIDAVIIATPDFAHSPILIEATKAKKDAYVEKPMATRLEHARQAVHLVKKNKTIVQVGTQYRSDARHKEAAKLIQSGVLGKISEVEAFYHDAKPRWARDYSDVRKEDIDWDEFLLYLPKQPFSAERFRRWHLFKDFTLGTPSLLGSHRIDVATWFMDDPLPVSAVALGGVYVWKDGREHADTVDCILEYPKEFILNYSTRLGNKYTPADLIFYGTRGTFDTRTWTAQPQGGGEAALDSPIPVGQAPTEDLGAQHVRNWLECIRSRKTPNAPIEAGYAHSVAGIMCFKALETGRRQKYDIEKMSIYEG